MQSVLHTQESPAREGEPVSKVTIRLVSEGVQNTSNLNKFIFAQQSSNSPSGIPSSWVEKGQKMPNMIDLSSTGISRYPTLANKHKQKYGSFSRLSLAIIGVCGISKKPTHLSN